MYGIHNGQIRGDARVWRASDFICIMHHCNMGLPGTVSSGPPLACFSYFDSNVDEKNECQIFSGVSFEILYDSLVYVGHKLSGNYLESMMIESPTMLEYAKYLSSYASFIISISAHPPPIPQIHLCSPLHRLIRIATRGVMEILGLDPYQSETQYLEGKIRVIAKRKQSGNAVAALLLLCCLFVSASWRSEKISGNKVETLLLLCCRFQNTYLQQGQQLQCPENRINQA